MRKRILSIPVAMMMLFCVFTDTVAETSTVPIAITLPNFIAPINLIDPDCTEMKWIAISDRAGLEAIVNNLNGNFYLTADIDLGGLDWTPIGFYNDSGSGAFTGIFDGQGHVIHNLTISTPHRQYEYNGGLFGHAWFAIIRNVGLENTDINLENTDSSVFVDSIGGIVGSIHRGEINNVYNTGSVSFNGITKNSSTLVGGIVGDIGTNTTIISVYNAANVTGGSHVQSTHKLFTGGIIGGTSRDYDISDTSISNSFNIGNISVNSGIPRPTYESYAFAGGIIATISGDMNISNTFNSGNVTAFGSMTFAGGFVGESNGQITVTDSYNTGSVSAVNVGGMIAKETHSTHIYRSYSVCDGKFDFDDFDFNNTWEIIDGANSGLPLLQVHRNWHIYNLRPVTRQTVFEFCPECGVKKQWLITRLFDTETGRLITERRATKRDSQGQLLSNQCFYTNSIKPSSESLPKELELRIKSDWLLKIYDYRTLELIGFENALNNVRIRKYFGSYDDSVVLIINGRVGRVWNMEVAGYNFFFHDTRGINVWNAGEFYCISEAYDNGLLTEHDVGEIHFKYSALLGVIEPLSDELLLRIEADWLDNTHSSPLGRFIFDEYHGSYNGSVALRIDVSTLNALLLVDVAGYSFVFPTPTAIVIWNDGVFFSLSQAYNNGLLTEKEVGEIHFSFENRH
jgi:hypothetical protein